MKRLIFFFALCVIFSSCVSKKKHLAKIQSLNRIHQDTFSTVTNDLKRQLRYSRDTVSDLRLDLAERKGENNILNLLRSELSTQIEGLEAQIETLSNNSQSNRTSLNNTLTKKEKQISDLKAQLKSIESAMDKRQEDFKKLSADMLFAFQEMEFEDFEATTSDEGLKVIFPKAVFFRKGYTNSIQKKGLSVMEVAAKVFSRYPLMQMNVVGHTNNKQPGSKRVSNNWSLSAMQAATIVDTFTEEYDINTSQLTASGKGEFAPKSSNATKEGQEMNDRIEWVISQRDADLERSIRKILKK
ncbi:MAG: OmpA family protein [Saprospiraceae bacterium]